MEPSLTYLIAMVFPSILLIFLMKEPESKSDERHLTFKVDIECSETRMAGQTSLVFYWFHSSVGRTIMCKCFYFYNNRKISDLASWQVSLIMPLVVDSPSWRVYWASQIGKNGIVIKSFRFYCTDRFGLAFGNIQDPFAYLMSIFLTNALMPSLSTHLLMIYKLICHPVCSNHTEYQFDDV